VADHCRGLVQVLTKGRIGERYHIGARCERTNLEVVHTLCRWLDELRPDAPCRPHRQLVQFVADRPGHDLRYGLDNTRALAELNWAPQYGFEQGMGETVQWYLDNPSWRAQIRAAGYAGQRLGQAT